MLCDADVGTWGPGYEHSGRAQRNLQKIVIVGVFAVTYLYSTVHNKAP
jgi:hypothetical protein